MLLLCCKLTDVVQLNRWHRASQSASPAPNAAREVYGSGAPQRLEVDLKKVLVPSGLEILTNGAWGYLMLHSEPPVLALHCRMPRQDGEVVFASLGDNLQGTRLTLNLDGTLSLWLRSDCFKITVDGIRLDPDEPLEDACSEGIRVLFTLPEGSGFEDYLNAVSFPIFSP